MPSSGSAFFLRTPGSSDPFKNALVAHERRLEALEGFGSNPGNLLGWTFMPEDLEHGAPLVVVLHGCTQTAFAYDQGSGWSRLAHEKGFALLFPEQKRANNPNLCFNWFSPVDSRRGSGEPASIHKMITTFIERHDLDPERVYITGLSAGGAMTSTMLATYPEMFAAGGIIAGLPYGAARSVQQALALMRGEMIVPDAELADAVRNASGHVGRWPRISVWQGENDRTVVRGNAERILKQWLSVLGIEANAAHEDVVDGANHRLWSNVDGEPLVEAFLIPGMDHGTPLAVAGDHPRGVEGPFMLDAGISSTRHLARQWSLGERSSAPLIVSSKPSRRHQRSAVSPSVPRISRSDSLSIVRELNSAVGKLLRKAGLK
ncbi:extracellular catalytic domain type 1 short-chain-length polyhydroxyalkanoate depolymerase [Novosphingobium terrae]|uniref:extracellular catalytic domain type 1 short-chain-length polyhydroxyalkanoate depolymerase n=1 Tax=Novosphingobium terrae TaxID=2726189 RepID=UPI0019824F0C|nr:PHB depolymerase family esterase [Novosphingobium terrae]